jgi:hypothetical protein
MGHSKEEVAAAFNDAILLSHGLIWLVDFLLPRAAAPPPAGGGPPAREGTWAFPTFGFSWTGAASSCSKARSALNLYCLAVHKLRI